MGTKISKRYSYKSQPKAFKLFLNFLSNGPHKTSFGIENWSVNDFFFFSFSLTRDPMGAKISKRLQIAAKSFQTFLEFSSQWSSQKYIVHVGFLKLWVWDFLWHFFENCKVTIVPFVETKNLNYLESEWSWSKSESNLGLKSSFMLYMCNFWKFRHSPNFIPKYRNFENWPISRKQLPVEQK